MGLTRSMILKFLTACTVMLTLGRNEINCDLSSYGSDGDEIILAIVNVTSREPFTGFVLSNKEPWFPPPNTAFREVDHSSKFAFGPKVSTVPGILIPVLGSDGKTNDACEPISSDQWASQPWIVLAKYGNCKDEQKLRNIARTNASAALIYDYRNTSRFIKLATKHRDVLSVFIPRSKGEELLSLMSNGSRVMVQLTIGPPSVFRYANINRTSVLFVSVSFIILMIISLAWLIFYYIQRFRYIQAKDILARRLCTAAKKALEKIPTRTLRAGDLQQKDSPSSPTTGSASITDSAFLECCAVCIETFKPADLVRILPCKHVFHKTCVDPWLLDQRSCPMCKLDILKFFGLTIFPSGSQESIFSEDFERTTRSHQRRETNRSQRLHQQQQQRNSFSHRGSGDVEIVHIPIPSRPGVISGNRDRRESSNRSSPRSPSSRSRHNHRYHHHSSHPHLSSSGHHFPSPHTFLSRRSSTSMTPTTTSGDCIRIHHQPTEVCVSPASCDHHHYHQEGRLTVALTSSSKSKERLFFPSSSPPAPVMMMTNPVTTIIPASVASNCRPSSGLKSVKTKVDVSVSIESLPVASEDVGGEGTGDDSHHEKKALTTRDSPASIIAMDQYTSSSLPSSPSSSSVAKNREEATVTSFPSRERTSSTSLTSKLI